VAQTATKIGGTFDAAAFGEHDRVYAVKKERDSTPVALEWDFLSGSQSETTLKTAKDFMARCVLDSHTVVGVAWVNHRWEMQISAPQGWHKVVPGTGTTSPFRSLADLLGPNCSSWRTDNFFLLEAQAEASVYWMSIRSDSEQKLCHSFPGEMVCGQAVSPDGSIAAVVTTSPEVAKRTEFPSDVPIFLNVLHSKSCTVSGRVALPFPEQSVLRTPLFASKNKYLDNSRFTSQLASRMAISPDNTMLALAYGIYKDPDGVAFFGVYSLPDGRRLATFRGDTFRWGVWKALRGGELWASGAPITGALQFSPDSRTLFASSRYIYQWDVSGLK
jgi:hypothetical protein